LNWISEARAQLDSYLSVPCQFDPSLVLGHAVDLDEPLELPVLSDMKDSNLGEDQTIARANINNLINARAQFIHPLKWVGALGFRLLDLERLLYELRHGLVKDGSAQVQALYTPHF